MPRYFFHCVDGSVEHDDEGVELADPQAARIEAVMYAGESLRDDPDQVWHGEDFRVEVTDERGELLFTIITLAIDARPATIPRNAGGPAPSR